MTNDVGDDMLNSLLEVQRTMSTELLQASFHMFPLPDHLNQSLEGCDSILYMLLSLVMWRGDKSTLSQACSLRYGWIGC
jgi:hypothetical protein